MLETEMEEARSNGRIGREGRRDEVEPKLELSSPYCATCDSTTSEKNNDPPAFHVIRRV